MLKRAEWRYFNELVLGAKIISFASAAPSLEVIEKYFGSLKNELEVLLDENNRLELFNYADVHGSELLRKRLILRGLAGDNSTEEMVLVTNGGQEAIKLIVETLLKKGEKIMVERLSYVGLEQAVLSSGGKVVCFSNNLNKLKLSEIEKELRANRPKLVYLIPDFSNPCGDNLEVKIRELIVGLASELSYWVIDDQTYRELYFDKNEQKKSMFLKNKKVILVGSISKTIVPGLRIGWLVVGDKELREKITNLKESFTLSTNSLNQKLVANLLQTEYEEKIRWVRNYYGNKMKITLENLDKKMPKGFSWTKPKGGFYIWISGPKDFVAKKALIKALDNGVGFIPGELFYYGKKEKNTFRLSISAIQERDIKSGIDRLVKTLQNKMVENKVNNGWIDRIKNLF